MEIMEASSVHPNWETLATSRGAENEKLTFSCAFMMVVYTLKNSFN